MNLVCSGPAPVVFRYTTGTRSTGLRPAPMRNAPKNRATVPLDAPKWHTRRGPGCKACPTLGVRRAPGGGPSRAKDCNRSSQFVTAVTGGIFKAVTTFWRCKTPGCNRCNRVTANNEIDIYRERQPVVYVACIYVSCARRKAVTAVTNVGLHLQNSVTALENTTGYSGYNRLQAVTTQTIDRQPRRSSPRPPPVDSNGAATDGQRANRRQPTMTTRYQAQTALIHWQLLQREADPGYVPPWPQRQTAPTSAPVEDSSQGNETPVTLPCEEEER